MSDRGPMCSTRCGPGWIDDGTMGRQRNRVKKPTGQPTNLKISNPPILSTPDSAIESDFVRAALILGMRALASEANKPGLFRGLTHDDVPSLARRKGLSPVAGTRPKPPATTAEATYRHTRPGGNAQLHGTDRISWTTKLKEAEAIAKKRGTTVVSLNREAAEGLGVTTRTPKQLLSDLAKWRQELSKELQATKGKNKAARIRASIKAVDDAASYIKRYVEHHTVGPVPQGAIKKGVLARVKIARNAGRVLLGLSIFFSIKRVAEAEEGRRGAVLIDEVAGLGMDLLLPGSGPIGSYATQTARGELRLLSQLFPTVYTWLLDAYIGEALEAADPEGARYIREALKTPQGQIRLLERMFGVPH